MSETTTVTVPPNSLVCYCPACGAYLFTLGLLGEMQCDQCGAEFEVVEEPAENHRP